MLHDIYLSIDDLILFPIQFLFRVNILGSEEWICNTEYSSYNMRCSNCINTN